MITSKRLFVECRGHYARGYPDYLDPTNEQWLPGDKDEIIGFRVFIGKVEVTREIDSEELEDLKREYLDYRRKEHEKESR